LSNETKSDLLSTQVNRTICFCLSIYIAIKVAKMERPPGISYLFPIVLLYLYEEQSNRYTSILNEKKIQYERKFRLRRVNTEIYTKMWEKISFLLILFFENCDTLTYCIDIGTLPFMSLFISNLVFTVDVIYNKNDVIIN